MISAARIAHMEVIPLCLGQGNVPCVRRGSFPYFALQEYSAGDRWWSMRILFLFFLLHGALLYLERSV